MSIDRGRAAIRGRLLDRVDKPMERDTIVELLDALLPTMTAQLAYLASRVRAYRDYASAETVRFF